ncbi:MAG: hypothetical protein R3300_20375 [Candidatus Promineifilaceae bacterium]|nr:hypothetical protein [Candidatus Promineifilaceae bacterium]
MSDSDQSRKDIRRILKTFGIQADEAMVAHLARNPYVQELRVRIVMEDLTDYGANEPHGELEVVIEDTVSR